MGVRGVIKKIPLLFALGKCLAAALDDVLLNHHHHSCQLCPLLLLPPGCIHSLTRHLHSFTSCTHSSWCHLSLALLLFPSFLLPSLIFLLLLLPLPLFLPWSFAAICLLCSSVVPAGPLTNYNDLLASCNEAFKVEKKGEEQHR